MADSTRSEIIDSLQTLLEDLKTNPDYPVNIRTISTFYENYLTIEKDKTPLLMVIDSGNDTVIVEDNEKTQWGVNIVLLFYLSGRSWIETQLETSGFIESVQKFVELNPTIHDNAIKLKFVESEGIQYDGKNKRSLCSVSLLLKYTIEKPQSDSDGGSYIYGTDYIKDAQDKLNAVLNELKTQLVGLSPSYSNVYDTHVKADIVPNALSTQFENNDEADVGANDYSVLNHMHYSVRLHMADIEDQLDTLRTGYLINSISNKLKANLSLGDDYWIRDISDIENNIEFAESATKGGELSVVIEIPTIHTQE